MRVPRTLVLILVAALGASVLTACEVRVAGKRCSIGSPLAQDATHVLECKGGRWARVATKVEVALRLAELFHRTPVTVAAGDGHACATMVDFKVRCWGQNDAGQLGDGTTTDRSLPGDVLGVTSRGSNGREWRPGVPVLGDRYSCAGDFTYARAQYFSERWCWGDDVFGTVDGVTTKRSTPTRAGGEHTENSVYGPTGFCASEQFGGGSSCAGTGARLFGRGTHAVGRAHVCFTSDASAVSCIGENDHGQLGDGSTTSIPLPPLYQAATTFASTGVQAERLVAGGDSTCVTIDNGVMCWGRNDHGQVGDGSTTDRLRPVVVPGLQAVEQLDLGHDHACVVDRDRLLRCWGANTNGQLGDGTTTDRPTPTLVPGLTNVTWMATGAGATCAVADRGADRQRLYCWGRNEHGQVGDGTTTERHEPTPVRF